MSAEVSWSHEYQVKMHLITDDQILTIGCSQL